MDDFETGDAQDATMPLRGAGSAPEMGAKETLESGLFTPGSLFLGKYNMQDRIGVGGMGVVYRCSQVFIGKELAIKTLNLHSMNDEAVQRFQTEAKAAGALSHPNIVSVHDFGVTDGGTPYMVMDYVPGRTLHDVLSAKGQLSLETVIDIFIQTSDALAHAHGKGVFHRDIKPSNIVLLQEESIGPGAIRILDFGIAKIASNSAQTQELTKTGMVIGSPLYMSPEQSIGKKMDARTDIYSLGCVLFECLCGAPPFQGETIIETLMLHQTQQPKSLREASLGREFPERLQELVNSMLAKKLEERAKSMDSVYQTLVEIKSSIKTTATGTPETPDKDRILSSPKNDAKRLAKLIGPALLSAKVMIAAVTLICVGITAFVFMQLTPPKDAEKIKPIAILDGRLSTPEIERASYDQKVRRALTESRSRGYEHCSIPICEFSQSQFEMLGRATWLKKATLIECSRFTPQGIKTLLSGNIEYLDLRGSELNDESIEAISKYGSRLRYLNLSKCFNISGKALASLARLKNLDILDLSALPVSDEVLKILVDGLPELRELSLAEIPYIGDHSASVLARHKAVWGLGLSSTSISDQGLKHFGNNVEWLYLTGNPRITDAGIETLISNCPKLRVLQIPGTSATPRIILKVLQLPKLTDLQIGSMNTDNATRQKIREVAKTRKINIYSF